MEREYSKSTTCLTSREVRGLQKIVHQNITQQVIGYMKENIESGNWKVGEKIPSEHELTALLGVSRSSIRQAVILPGSASWKACMEKGPIW